RPGAERADRQSGPGQYFIPWRMDLRKIGLDFVPAQSTIVDSDLVHQPVKRVPSRDLRVDITIWKHRLADATDQKINGMGWCFELYESIEVSNLFAVDVEREFFRRIICASNKGPFLQWNRCFRCDGLPAISRFHRHPQVVFGVDAKKISALL